MKNYIFKFTGRECGAIGITYPIIAGISAENLAAAVHWLYTKYEHLTSVTVLENNKDVSNYYDVCTPVAGRIASVDMSYCMRPELIEFANLLKTSGFTVFMYHWDNAPRIDYFSFTNGRGFGYVQYERLGGPWSFSSLHLPNRSTGTAYGFGNELNVLTIKNAEIVCSNLNPSWATLENRDNTKPYKGVSDFLRINRNCFVF